MTKNLIYLQLYIVSVYNYVVSVVNKKFSLDEIYVPADICTYDIKAIPNIVLEIILRIL